MSENSSRENLEDRNRRLKAAVSELAILNDIATAVSSASSLDEVISLIVEKCVKHLEAKQCTVTLLDKKTEDSPFKTLVRGADTSGEMRPMRLDTQISGWMIKNKKPLIVNDIKNDKRFHSGGESSHLIKSMLCAPLAHKGKLLGSINVFNKKPSGGFTEENKRLLSIIASQSAQVIKNASLIEEEKAYRTLREEMNIAYKIQMQLLPSKCPIVEGYDIAGRSIPAKTVGGDYFDFIPCNPGKLAFCLGDVVGKGVPAALLMANTQATLRGQVENDLSPSCVMERSNSLLFRSTDTAKFVTLFLAYLYPESHRIICCNAGHEYPLIFRNDDKIEHIETKGLILGAIENFDFGEKETKLEPADILLLYSDGVTEAFNEEGQQFGIERLQGAIRDYRNRSSEGMISGVIEAVRKFAGKRKQSDDITLIVVKRDH